MNDRYHRVLPGKRLPLLAVDDYANNGSKKLLTKMHCDLYRIPINSKSKMCNRKPIDLGKNLFAVNFGIIVSKGKGIRFIGTCYFSREIYCFLALGLNQLKRKKYSPTVFKFLLLSVKSLFCFL